MKYVFLLAAVALVYFILIRQSPDAKVTDAIAHPEAADTTINLKRPIDRTNEVLDQVKSRNGNGEF
jgi:hypothetical protein